MSIQSPYTDPISTTGSSTASGSLSLPQAPAPQLQPLNPHHHHQQQQQQQHLGTAMDVFTRGPPPTQPTSNLHPTTHYHVNETTHTISSDEGVEAYDVELPRRSSSVTTLPSNTFLPQHPLHSEPYSTTTTATSQPQQQQQQEVNATNVTSSSLSSTLSLCWIDMNKSLDDLADEFFIGSSRDCNENPNVIANTAILNPDPLPAHMSDYERMQILVGRRAYMDALLYTRMLLEGSTSHYTYLFDAMKHLYSSSGDNNNNDMNNNSNRNRINAIELALDTHKQDLIRIMTIHIVAMIKLNLVLELVIELDSWTFCFHNRFQQRRQLEQQQGGHVESAVPDTIATADTVVSWIPWTFHILAASTVQFRQIKLAPIAISTTTPIDHTTQQDDCLDALWCLRDAIPKTDTASIVEVENTIQNVLLTTKQYRMALECIQRMIHLIPSIVQADISNYCGSTLSVPIKDDGEKMLHDLLSAMYQCEYLSRQGRILLQVGALDAADAIFQQICMLYRTVSSLSTPHSSHDTNEKATNAHPTSGTYTISAFLVRVMKAQISSNDGLFKFSKGRYEEALESFNTVVQELRVIGKERSNDWKQQSSIPMLGSIRSSLYGETMNNVSLCALYTCRLHEAIKVLESLIRDDVTTNLSERVTLNICTMYELAMDTNAAMQKKKILQCIATRFLIQDIPTECFRIS
jgi:tetratricopeptide (TPR) repeat protein